MPDVALASDGLMDQNETCSTMSWSPATQWRRIDSGLFPKAVRVGGITARMKRWPKGEVLATQQAMVAGADEEQLRELVANMHAARRRELDAVLAAARARAVETEAVARLERARGL